MQINGHGVPLEFDLPPRTNEPGKMLIAAAASTPGEWAEVNTHAWEKAEFCALTALHMAGVLGAHEHATCLGASERGLTLHKALQEDDAELSITVKPGGADVAVSLLTSGGDAIETFTRVERVNFLELLPALVYGWSRLGLRA